MPSFNVIISTIDRPSLDVQLRSLVTQLKKEDCITVVFDGKPINNLDIFKEFVSTVDLYSEPEALGYWGHAVRNKYSQLIKKCDFILHGDDDDIYAPNAFELLRQHCVDMNTLYIAKMEHNLCGIIPKEPVIKLANIGTPCGIVPWFINSNPDLKWGYFYGGDCLFYHNASTLTNSVVFLDFVIYIVRPSSV